ncbi:hypothetical protein NMY22_g8569 [Coprinellus aureogranulatus]|nr:hypothetical protein NMY22_g8569 [Coprinellus aureogranulatus]
MSSFSLNRRSVSVARTSCYRTLVSSRVLPGCPSPVQLSFSTPSCAYTVGLSPTYVSALEDYDVVLGTDISCSLSGVLEGIPFCEGHGVSLHPSSVSLYSRVVDPVTTAPAVMGVTACAPTCGSPSASPRFAQRMCQTHLTSDSPESGVVASSGADVVSGRSPDIDPCIERTDASTSSLPPSSEVYRNGEYYAFSLLNSRSNRGITANPFSDDIHVLRRLLDAHGINHVGTCRSAASCRVLLFRHLFSGECVVRQHDRSPPLGCQLCSRGYADSMSMCKSLFQYLSCVAVRLMDDSRLVAIAHALDLQMTSVPSRFRRRLQLLFARESTRYLQGGSSSPFSDIPTILKKFSHHKTASLVELARQHGISCSPATATPLAIRSLILQHLSSGGCSTTAMHHGYTAACAEFAVFVEDSSARMKFPEFLEDDVADEDEFNRTVYLAKVLSVLRDHLARPALEELLTILSVPFPSTNTKRSLQSLLFAHIQELRSTLLQWDHRAISSSHSITPLDAISSKWGTIPTQEVKDDCILRFRNLTSSDTNRKYTCASCSCAYFGRDIQPHSPSDVDFRCFLRPDFRRHPNTNAIVDPTYAQGVGTDFSDARCFASEPNCLLDPRGRYLDHNSEWKLRFCRDCWSHCSRGRVPPLSLANHNYIGPIPDELSQLSYVEEQMIARCRAKVSVIKMYNKDKLDSVQTEPAWSPVIQRGLKGNIIVFPQEPSELAEILPPSVEEVAKPIVMVFIGNSKPTDEWLREKATPLLVRPAYVRRALVWLKENNPLYREIEINETELQKMPEEFILPVEIEHLHSSVSSEVSASRYDMPYDDNEEPEPESDDIRFENIVMTNLTEAATADQLKTLASKHVKEENGAFLQVPHDVNPANEFYNKTLYPSMYPTLYPYGLGGFENQARTSELSFHRHVKRCFWLDDP